MSASLLELDSAGQGAADFSKGSIFFVGTATVIIRYAGFTLLTDPNFLHAGDHIHLGFGLTSKRLTNPAMGIEDLPALDLCILSHMHADHFDRLAAARLNKDLPIVTTPHAAGILRRKGFRRLHPLKRWEPLQVKKGRAGLRIASMPAQHASALLSPLFPEVMGSMLEFKDESGAKPFKLYISGDTLLFDGLKRIAQRHRDIDLMLLHLGGTRIMGITLTMDARQGVEALRLIRPHSALPVHYNDYGVFKSPLEDFRKAAAQAELDTQLIYLRHGETYEFTTAAGQAERYAQASR